MIKEIIFGTKNQAKLQQIVDALEPIGVKVKSIEEFKVDINPPEDSNDPVENAKVKAVTYAKVIGQTVLGMDNGLYFDDLSFNKQPGVFVRRINNRTDRPTDQELLDYYQNLVAELGERIKAYWRFGFCIASPEKIIGQTEIISRRIFVSTPSEKTQEGYPLESLQIDSATGKYVSEMTDEERKLFWQNAIGKELCEFISKLNVD